MTGIPLAEELDRAFAQFGFMGARLVTQSAGYRGAHAIYKRDNLLLHFGQEGGDYSLGISRLSKPDEQYGFMFIAVLLGRVEFDDIYQIYARAREFSGRSSHSMYKLSNIISVLARSIDQVEELFSERNAEFTHKKLTDMTRKCLNAMCWQTEQDSGRAEKAAWKVNPFVDELDKCFSDLGIVDVQLVTHLFDPPSGRFAKALYVTRNLILHFLRSNGNDTLGIASFSKPDVVHDFRLVAVLVGHVGFDEVYRDYARPIDFSVPPPAPMFDLSATIAALAANLGQFEDLFSDANAEATDAALNDLGGRCLEARRHVGQHDWRLPEETGKRVNPLVAAVERELEKVEIADARLVGQKHDPGGMGYAGAVYVAGELILKFVRRGEDHALAVAGISRPDTDCDFRFVAVLIGHIDVDALSMGHGDTPDPPLPLSDPALGLSDMISVLSRHMQRIEALLSEANAASTQRSLQEIEGRWREAAARKTQRGIWRGWRRGKS